MHTRHWAVVAFAVIATANQLIPLIATQDEVKQGTALEAQVEGYIGMALSAAMGLWDQYQKQKGIPSDPQPAASLSLQKPAQSKLG